MRAVVQRVARARVEVGGEVTGAIDRGLLVYVSVGADDELRDIEWMADKVANLRVYEDGEGKMNRSVVEEGGEFLVVSQFTLHADARKGRRPSYSAAASPDRALPLYREFVECLSRTGLPVREGRFQAEMEVTYTNMGPVTILLDSKKTF